MLKHFSLPLLASIAVIILTSLILSFHNQQPTAPLRSPQGEGGQPSSGCYYQEVQCIRAPCDPILVCPSPTPVLFLKPTLTSVSGYLQISDLEIEMTLPEGLYLTGGSIIVTPNMLYNEQPNIPEGLKVKCDLSRLGPSPWGPNVTIKRTILGVVKNDNPKILKILTQYKYPTDWEPNEYLPDQEESYEIYPPKTPPISLWCDLLSPQLESKVLDVLKSIKPTTQNQSPTSYVCPLSGWVDCMPGPGPAKTQCQKNYLDWIKVNCPDFEGVAY